MKLANSSRISETNPVSLPPRLYKYESFSTRALQNLKSQIIHFGSPLHFNDPYDCALTANIKMPSDEDVESIRAAYLGDESLPLPQRKQFETLDVAQLREKFLRAARDALCVSTANFRKTRGLACFSECNDDLLMWSHYGGRYKGFCLEFATASEAFAKVRSVRYAPTLPAIEVATILFDNNFDPILELFCTKSLAWKYEAEWRSIHAVAGTEYGYPPDALTGVYFGPDIDQQCLEIVCLILAGQNRTVRLWKGKRSTTEFRVLFEEVTYTSYLEANRSANP